MGIVTAAIHSTMQPLFGEDGMRRLDMLMRPGVLCAFDFDGTLAPIVERPDEASLPDDIRHRLIALSGRAPVAVITGRSVSDIKVRLGFEPAYVVGNHGIEGVPGAEQVPDDYHGACRAWLRQLEPALRESGVQIEDKGSSLSVHYRLTSNPADAAARLQETLTRLEPAPRIVDGKYVFNLLPTHAADKGRAIETLIAICSAPGAIYVGDDVTDEDVFRLRRPDIMSIRIECAAASAAEFYVSQRGDIVRLLDLMIEKLDARQAQMPGNVHAVHT
jgi:trehalose 6-phosphate phosphatase